MKIFWTKYLRIFTNGDKLNWTIIPKFKLSNYHKNWNLFGFHIHWLNKEVIISINEDIHGFY